jgi:hypothetical protein
MGARKTRRGALRLAAVACVIAVVAIAAAAAAGSQIFVQTGDLEITFNAMVKPKTLPRSKRAPIAVSISNRVVTKGTARIPAITRAAIEIDRSVAVDSRGIPACSSGQLENQTTETAEAACRPALVAGGSVGLEIATRGGTPIRTQSRLLAFNGGVSGKATTIFVHAYITVPAAEAIVVPVTLTKRKGAYGLRARVAVPKIASGTGSVTAFDLSFKRQVATRGGGKHGYLLANCTDGNLVFEPEASFADGGLARGLLALGCTPAGEG